MDTLDGLNTFMGWLGRTSLQAAVLALMILVVQALTRDRIPPRWRHALWFLLIIRLMLPWAPSNRMSVYNLIEPAGRRSTVAAETGTAPSLPAISVHAATQPAPMSGPISLAQPEAAKAHQQSFWENVRPKTRPTTTIAAVWLIGFIAFLCAALFQSLKLGAAMRGRRPVTDQRLLELLESCKDAMNFPCWLMVIETPDVKSPALFGFIRPKLLIPAGAIDDLGLDRLRHVFLHELAHLKRRDILSNWLATVLLAAHWFNPLIWYAFHRMRADQELACDHLALSSINSNESRDYGRTIIHLLEKFSQPARMPGLAGILEDQSQMKRRISMIAKFKAPSRKWSAVAVLLMCTLGCVALTNASQKPGRADSSASTESSKPRGKGIDLELLSVKLDRYPAGNLYQVVIRHRNHSNVPCPRYNQAMLLDGKEIMSGGYQGGPYKPGEYADASSKPFALPEGTHEITVILDPDNKLKDVHPENNKKTLTITVLDGIPTTENALGLQVKTTTDAEGHYVDKIDYPFVTDPRVIGQWESIDFVREPDQFKPGHKQWSGDLFYKGTTFFPDGTSTDGSWTRGLVFNHDNQTASRYIIKEIDGQAYMIVEWKTGDYSIRHEKPFYYVLRQVSKTAIKADAPKRIIDKIDYPFENDPDVLGQWSTVDYVTQIQQFNPEGTHFDVSLHPFTLAFLESGKVRVMSGDDQALGDAPWYTWTKDILMHRDDLTASHYEIKRIGGKTYMFLEHKSGDYSIRGMKPNYYVLVKM